MKEVSLAAQGELRVSVANGKMQASQLKLDFWSSRICHYELESFPILKHPSGEVDGDSECDFWYCTVKRFSHPLEDWLNSVNQ